MPLLQVRDFPKELYDNISQVARAENRSIPQQTIVLLKTALNNAQERKALKKAALMEIDSFNIKNADTFPPPEELTREDRDR
jgi:hypothetical protein